ncbi:MAG: M3 family metallopeptidase, partial [Myxococcota bacterium]
MTSASKPAPKPHEALLAEWSGPHGGVPPWDEVDTQLFMPAFEQGAAMMLEEVETIADNPEAPTFENTVVALERAGKPLDRVATLFFVMSANRNTPEIQKLSGTVRPMLAKVTDQVNFNPKLFARVKAIYDARETSGLNAEQKRLVEKYYEGFVRRGANLDEAQKKRMGEINQELAKLFNDFSNRVLADEDTFVVLTDKDLKGLPASMVSAYKAAAQKRNVEGYAIVNTRSAVDPFLTFSDNRALREKVWRRFIMRGDNGDKNDTKALIGPIVKLRAERAKMLGFDNHAQWRMSTTMAKKPERAMELMMRVWPAAVSRVRQEVKAMRSIAQKKNRRFKIEPWDYRYYMEKVRKKRYDLDQNEFKNYFELNNMIAASYYMADKLYGYAFEEVTGKFSVFQEDVRVYHVTNKADGSHVGYLYRDDFARQYKRSGAWQATYQTQSKIGGHQVDAIVSNNNNFTKAGEGEPVLISLDDAQTLFHEFGHALHALTNDTTYPTLAGTPRDFVEFPSQVHENWVLTREVLDKYARHYKTGEKMPQSLIDKMRAAATFNQGFATVEYLSAAIVDMMLHTQSDGEVDAAAFEKMALAKIGMPKEIVLRHRLPHFLHLFASDAYSAGYYSYLWSDVMAADAWQAFEEAKDPWHPETAKKF